MFKKLVRWFNERALGFVYYEIKIANDVRDKSGLMLPSGEVVTEMHTHWEFSSTQKIMETKMKRTINVFEGTPINKIKFDRKYV